MPPILEPKYTAVEGSIIDGFAFHGLFATRRACGTFLDYRTTWKVMQVNVPTERDGTEDPDHEPQGNVLVIHINLYEGCTAYGPFADQERAEDWARHMLEGDYTSVDLVQL